MNKKQQEEFISLIEQGTLRALESEKGKKAILNVLASPEARDILVDFFVDSFHDVLDDTMDHITKDLSDVKSDVEDLRLDVNYLKESAVKRDKFIEDVRNKIVGRA